MQRRDRLRTKQRNSRLGLRLKYLRRTRWYGICEVDEVDVDDVGVIVLVAALMVSVVAGPGSGSQSSNACSKSWVTKSLLFKSK